MKTLCEDTNEFIQSRVIAGLDYLMNTNQYYAQTRKTFLLAIGETNANALNDLNALELASIYKAGLSDGLRLAFTL